MTDFDIANGGAVAFALAFAFGVPKKEVKAATGLYLFVAFNWWFYVMSNEPHGPLEPLWDAGIYLRYDDAWTLLDALTAIFAALAGWSTRSWWFASVYLLGLTQIGFHVAYWTYEAIPSVVYYQSLNVLYWGILSAVIFAGGRGVKNGIVRGCAVLRAVRLAGVAQGGLRSVARLVRPK